jgi:hypothetical protein
MGALTFGRKIFGFNNVYFGGDVEHHNGIFAALLPGIVVYC